MSVNPERLEPIDSIRDFQQRHARIFAQRERPVSRDVGDFVQRIADDLKGFSDSYPEALLARDPGAKTKFEEEFSYYRGDFLREAADDSVKTDVAQVLFDTRRHLTDVEIIESLKRLPRTDPRSRELEKYDKREAARNQRIMRIILESGDSKSVGNFWKVLESSYEPRAVDDFHYERRGVLAACAVAHLLRDSGFGPYYANVDEDAVNKVDLMAVPAVEMVPERLRDKLRNSIFLFQVKSARADKAEFYFSDDFTIDTVMDREVQAFLSGAKKSRDELRRGGLSAHAVFMRLPLSYHTTEGRFGSLVDETTGEPQSLLKDWFSRELDKVWARLDNDVVQ